MKKRFVEIFVLSVFAVIFAFSGPTQAWHAYNDTQSYTLTELWLKIQAGDKNVYGAHMWINAKCIEFFEERTGIELSESARLYITLGAITADYDIDGSSSTRENYNEVNWSIKLGDTWDSNNLVYYFLTNL